MIPRLVFPDAPARRPEWLAPASRVFLGVCLLATGAMVLTAARDYRAAVAGKDSLEQIEQIKREVAGRALSVILKADQLEREMDRDAHRRTQRGE